MAGTFVYWMNVSLDLRIEHAPGESGGKNWLRIDKDLYTEFNARASEMSLMVQGRIAFETMENYWPAAALDPSLPAYLVEYGQIWTVKPKFLVSRTRTTAAHNTRVIGAGAISELAHVRSTTPGRIGVGGANLASQLLAANLLDEVKVFIHPVILGSGRTLFDRPHSPIDLDLLEQRRFSSGATLHRYAVRGASR